MIGDFLFGFSLGFSLLLAIGAQNAFIIRQGIRGEHVLWVCLTCAFADALLILAGVFGIGLVSQEIHWIDPAVKIFGASFLLIYGSICALSAIRDSKKLNIVENIGITRVKAIAISLALAFLNPHVYLETVFLIGSLSTQYDHSRIFGLGAISASFVFFFSLGFAARLLAPIFQSHRAWRVLDGVVSLIMYGIAFSLLYKL